MQSRPIKITTLICKNMQSKSNITIFSTISQFGGHFENTVTDIFCKIYIILLFKHNIN